MNSNKVDVVRGTNLYCCAKFNSLKWSGHLFSDDGVVFLFGRALPRVCEFSNFYIKPNVFNSFRDVKVLRHHWPLFLTVL